MLVEIHTPFVSMLFRFLPPLGGAVSSGYQQLSDQSLPSAERLENVENLDSHGKDVGSSRLASPPQPCSSDPSLTCSSLEWGLSSSSRSLAKSFPELHPSQEGLSREKGVWEPESHCPRLTGIRLQSFKATPYRLEQLNLVPFLRGWKHQTVELWKKCNSQNRVWAPLVSLMKKAELCCLRKLLVDLSHWEFKEPGFWVPPPLVLKNNLFVC